MLLNLPANSMSRANTACWSSMLGHRSEPSAPAKNDVEKPGMFTINMPSSANPRTMSSVAMRSSTGSGLTVSNVARIFSRQTSAVCRGSAAASTLLLSMTPPPRQTLPS